MIESSIPFHADGSASSETHLVQDSDHDLFSRLDRIEGLLLEAKSHRSAATKSHLADQPYAPLDYQFPTLSSRLAENQLCGETENSDVVVFGFDLHCLSSFRTKEFHQALLPLRVNDFEESLEQELKEGKSLFEGDQVELLNLDLSHQNCGRLQQLFTRNVLPQRPIFDHEASAELVARVTEERPVPKNP